MMLNNEEIVRELYAAAEGSGKDIAKLVSFFSDEGYMCDIPSGMKREVGATAADNNGPASPLESCHASPSPKRRRSVSLNPADVWGFTKSVTTSGYD